MNLSVERRQTSLGSRTLSYLAAGPLPGDRLVVLLHAFPLSADMWLPQLQALPDGWAALAPDFRGFGGSSPDYEGPRAEARLEDYADDVGELLDGLGVPQAALCGCSMGGYTAFAIMRRFPGRATGLLLADTRATADSDAARASRTAMLDLLDREGPAAVAAEMRPKLVGPTSQGERPQVLETVDRLMRQATAPGIGFAVSRMRNRPDAAPELHGFRGPVSIVVGEEDALTPPADAASMAASLRRAAFVTIPRAGHLSNLEAPDAFNTAMGAWLAAVSEASA